MVGMLCSKKKKKNGKTPCDQRERKDPNLDFLELDLRQEFIEIK